MAVHRRHVAWGNREHDRLGYISDAIAPTEALSFAAVDGHEVGRMGILRQKDIPPTTSPGFGYSDEKPHGWRRRP